MCEYRGRSAPSRTTNFRENYTRVRCPGNRYRSIDLVMTTPSHLIVIFGAAVDRNGEPSAALLRRIGYGHAAARLYPLAPILCSGGVVRPGPSEASIIAARLEATGISPQRLILDEVSLNTLQNVAAAVYWTCQGGHPSVVICSDAYHLPRIRMMLGFHGVDALRGPVPAGPGTAPLGHWLAMCLRETLAIPFYLAMLIAGSLRSKT